MGDDGGGDDWRLYSLIQENVDVDDDNVCCCGDNVIEKIVYTLPITINVSSSFYRVQRARK